MRATTREMITKVRQNLFEFQTTVISDDYILSKLNEAYQEVYNILIKQYPDVIVDTVSFAITDKERVFLPRELKSARVLSVYSEVYRRNLQLHQISYTEYLKIKNNDVYQTSLGYPACYALNHDYIYLYPKTTAANLTITFIPELVQLGHLIGHIDRVNSNNLPLYATSEYIDSIPNEQNIVTITDAESGLIKKSFDVTVENDTLKLNIARKERYKGLDITSVETNYFEKAYILGDGSLQVLGSTNLSLGDVIYVDSPLQRYKEYYTTYSTTLSGTEPDFKFDTLSFEGLYTVSNITGTVITLTPAETKTYIMPIKNGYNTTFTGTLNTAIINFSVLEAGVDYTTIQALAHGLGNINDVTWVSVLGGPAYVKATVLNSQTLELAYEVTTETQIQAKIVEVNPDYLNSFPRMFTSGTEQQVVSVLQATKNSLLLLEEADEVYENDLASLGASAGTHMLDTHFEKYLTYYATALIKDSIQEDASMLMRMLDGILRDVHANIGSRKLNRRMLRETPIVNNIVSWRQRK